MRVLLIDNHDSFTFNVAHDIAAVVGVLPEVVLNDAPPVAASQVDQWLDSFDAIVVSPGPGTPECAADLGISAAAIAQREVPLLGICLGMQAMGHALGVPVIRAPRPVHGEIAQVEHSGGGLFEGLDSPVPMVRYIPWFWTQLPPPCAPASSSMPGRRASSWLSTVSTHLSGVSKPTRSRSVRLVGAGSSPTSSLLPPGGTRRAGAPRSHRRPRRRALPQWRRPARSGGSCASR